MTIDPAGLIDDRPEKGVFRVNRAIFREPGIFDLEMRHIFEGGWVFLGLASQAPAPHDFFTTYAGRVPILVTRDGDGQLRAFVNSCPHKGAQVAQTRAGNARLHVCPYHSWTFDSAGKNRGLKWQRAGCYAEAFDESDHGLTPLPHFDEYRGFLFGSLVAGVPTLAGHLGGDRRRITGIEHRQFRRGGGIGLVERGGARRWRAQIEVGRDDQRRLGRDGEFVGRLLGQPRFIAKRIASPQRDRTRAQSGNTKNTHEPHRLLPITRPLVEA